MGLSNLPEWAKQKPEGDPLEAEVRKQADRISTLIADMTQKRFAVSKADDRIVVTKYDEGEDPAESDNTVFTVTDLHDGEYMIAAADATWSTQPIFVGPLDDTLEIVRKEMIGSLEPWERPDTDPETTISDEELERLFNPPTDQPPPPGMN